MENNILEPGQARLNITWARQNGDLPDPVNFDSTDQNIRDWATEAVRNGSVPGIVADPQVDFTDFIVDRFAATETRNYSVVQLRPKTAFGA